MEAIWTKTVNRPTFETLQSDIKTDVLIVGGGVAGILCGYLLKQSGIECIIVDADRICSGTTKNTTAKITIHHGAIFDKMAKKYGDERTKIYLSANEKALSLYKDLCENLDCNFETKDSYVYSVNNREKIENEAKILNKLGFNASFCDKLDLPISVSGAVRLKNQAQFNPLKFCYKIARNLKIYENTRVLEISENEAFTNRGKIRAKNIIIATHFPFINTAGGYFVKMYQHRSYVLALENAQKISGMYVDEADVGLSFREYNDMLLLGGGGHKTGKSGGNWQELEVFARANYPNSKVICRWAAQDCKTLDDIPYIGRYSASKENLFVATGLNKWGMTGAMVSAMLLRDALTGKKNEFSEVFQPSRSVFSAQLFKNLANSFAGIIRPTAPRCPHLGCALVYNKAEHSWDCPCHGSRFDSKGRLLNNPATHNKDL